MIRVSTLTGALLDYWVARAEGVPAAQLIIRSGPCAELDTCSVKPPTNAFTFGPGTFAPSTSWSTGGPLIEKHELTLMRWKYSTIRMLEEKDFWAVELPCASHYIDTYRDEWADEGSATPLQAICRAVVRAAFGDEVEDIKETQ